jgi:hypothetical protein
MEDRTRERPLGGQFVPRRNFMRQKEKPFRTKHYLDFLAHYDAELVQGSGPIMVVRCKTGSELPLEQKAKLHMVRLLLDEFGTVDAANDAVKDYKSSRS